MGGKACVARGCSTEPPKPRGQGHRLGLLLPGSQMCEAIQSTFRRSVWWPSGPRGAEGLAIVSVMTNMSVPTSSSSDTPASEYLARERARIPNIGKQKGQNVLVQREL